MFSTQGRAAFRKPSRPRQESAFSSTSESVGKQWSPDTCRSLRGKGSSTAAWIYPSAAVSGPRGQNGAQRASWAQCAISAQSEPNQCPIRVQSERSAECVDDEGGVAVEGLVSTLRPFSGLKCPTQASPRQRIQPRRTDRRHGLRCSVGSARSNSQHH